MWAVRKGRHGLMKLCGRVQSFLHPSHKPWFIWTEQLHRPTTLIIWPSRNPGDRGGPEKNGVVRLVIPSTSTRFTSTALYNVYAGEEGQKIKTFLAFATLSHYANQYITQKNYFLPSHYRVSQLGLSVYSVPYFCHKCFRFILNEEMDKVASSTTKHAVEESRQWTKQSVWRKILST